MQERVNVKLKSLVMKPMNYEIILCLVHNS